jgi:hypothetical protein
MSKDWRRLHQVRRVSGGSPETHWVPWLIHKKPRPKTEDGGVAASDRSDRWVRLVRPVGTGLTCEEHRSDRCATMQSGDFEAEDTCRDRKACVEAKKVCGR